MSERSTRRKWVEKENIMKDLHGRQNKNVSDIVKKIADRLRKVSINTMQKLAMCTFKEVLPTHNSKTKRKEE